MQIIGKDDESGGIDPNDSSEKHRTKEKKNNFVNECNIDNKNAELMKRAMLLFSKQKCSRGITSVSALRSLLKLKNMKESQRLCTILEKYGVLTKLGKGGRTTSYKIELSSPAFARVFSTMKVKGETDDDDSPTDCEGDIDAESAVTQLQIYYKMSTLRGIELVHTETSSQRSAEQEIMPMSSHRSISDQIIVSLSKV